MTLVGKVLRRVLQEEERQKTTKPECSFYSIVDALVGILISGSVVFIVWLTKSAQRRVKKGTIH